MDNASKALILAGGVLLAIMIIAVSMYILSEARGLATTANIQAQVHAANSFNRFYNSYGSKITGLDVLNIYNKALSDTSNGNPVKVEILVSSKYGNLISALQAYTGAEYMSNIYSYKVDSYDSYGYINHVTISK